MSNILEIVSEFISIVVCMHKISQKRFKRDPKMLLLIGMYLMSVMLQKIGHINFTITIVAIVTIFLYEKWYLTESVKAAIKGTCICCILIMSLQLITFYLTNEFFLEKMNKYLYGVCVNCCIILVILFWNEKYIKKLLI